MKNNDLNYEYLDLDIVNKELMNLSSLEIIEWGFNKFGNKLAFTTSFGIQSSVLLHQIQNSELKNKVKIFWMDTGYLPEETYKYAKQLIDLLSLNIEVLQSELSPAHMEAIYGKLWESKNPQDLDFYHKLRKVKPLEKALKKYSVSCWGSGVRAQQTNNRNNMRFIDFIRNRLSIRPLLGWTNKEIYYYMEKENLPQHPLFYKGYSTVGDWHSSSPESQSNQGRNTRFGGLKEECGLHTNT